MSPRFLTLLLASALLASPLAAQGNVGGQGFGYPIGPSSAGALGAGSAGAELDPNSALNPAAVIYPARFSLMLQLEPELRQTEVAGRSSDASVVRFPAFQVTGAWRRFGFAAGVSTFLERAWRATYPDSVLVAGSWESTDVTATSSGGISDVRAAVAYAFHRRLQAGVSLHGFSGRQQLSLTHRFPDSSGIGGLQESSRFGFSGTGITLGIIAEPLNNLQVGLSYRSGGDFTLDEGDRRLATATVPGRVGVGLAYSGIQGIAILARLEQTRWTDMAALGTDQLSVFDGTDVSIGGEFLGPRIFGTNSTLRAGFRTRNLPFGVGSDEVRERISSFGFGVPVAEARGQIDVAIQRAFREGGGAEERAWLLTVGFGIRP